MIRRAWLKLGVFLTLLLNNRTYDEVINTMGPYCEVVRLYPKKLIFFDPEKKRAYARYYSLSSNNIRGESYLLFHKTDKTEYEIIIENLEKFNEYKYCYIGKYEDYVFYAWSSLKLEEEYE